jgi:ADP-heptose:LPS heptosyltransferase
MTLPKRVLAIRLDTIGDVIMATPALGAMADAGSHVTLLTSTIAGPLQPLLPYLRDVVTLDVPWMKHGAARPVSSSAHLKVLEHLRAERFDIAFIFTVSTQDPSCAAYLAYLCGIPRIAAYVRGKLYGLVTDPLHDDDPPGTGPHEVVRQLRLVESLGFPTTRRSLRLDIPAPSRGVRALLDHIGPVTWCLIHPGASAQSRRYPIRQWARVIDHLEASGIQVVLAGGKQDRAQCTEIAALSRHAPVRADGRFGLADFAALVQAAPVAVTCNSAASHVAAAAGTPVVTLYAGTNSQHGPWSDRATVLRHATSCAWCYSSVCSRGTPVCTAGIPPELVAKAVLDRLIATAAGPAAEIIDASAGGTATAHAIAGSRAT